MYAGTSDGNVRLLCVSGRYGTFQVLPEKSSGQLVLLGAKQPPPPHSAVSGVGWGWGGGVLRSLRLRSRGEEVSRWLLILQDEAPGPRRWERAPPLCGLAPLGGGGGSVSGPARRGPAVGRAGWSQEAGVQGRGHWRARQVLWQTHVRQPCFCSVRTFFLTIVLKKGGGGNKATTDLQERYILQQQPQNPL